MHATGGIAGQGTSPENEQPLTNEESVRTPRALAETFLHGEAFTHRGNGGISRTRSPKINPLKAVNVWIVSGRIFSSGDEKNCDSRINLLYLLSNKFHRCSMESSVTIQHYLAFFRDYNENPGIFVNVIFTEVTAGTINAGSPYRIN